MSFKGNTSLDESGSTCAVSTKSVKDLCHNEEFELKSPELRASEEIGLFITCAGHPTKFLFQVAKYENDLRHLEAAMSEFYNNEEIEGLAEHKIVKNKVYAACDEDRIWHRVVVTDSILGSRVPVRFCDYGEVILAPISSLRELKPEFRKNPFMAMKGQLAGVRPLVENWSMDDCLRFGDLVEDQLLTGTVVGILDDKINPMERTVFLNLINVSNDVNVDIAEVLVSENRAIRDG